LNTSGFVKHGGALVALAIVSACGGGSAVAPSSAAVNSFSYVGRTLSVNGRPVTAARPPGSLPHFEPFLPDLPKGVKKLEYVFNDYNTYTSIFDYPKSTKQIGTLEAAGGQGCTNVLYGFGKKIFWNVGGPTQITEYKVEKTPIKTLSVNYTFPSSCAMDAAGDLAVGILYNYSGTGGGDVVIFKNASGSGKVYTTPLDEEFFDGYDPKGDLFASGFTGDRSGFALVGLLNGTSKFVTINTSNSPQFPGSVQWDGKYVTLFDQYTNEVYQYTISGTKATLEGTVQLTGAGDCAQTWIVPGLIYCGDADYGDGAVFKYPAGGSPVAILSGSFDFPLGMTAAEK